MKLKKNMKKLKKIMKEKIKLELIQMVKLTK